MKRRVPFSGYTVRPNGVGEYPNGVSLEVGLWRMTSPKPLRGKMGTLNSHTNEFTFAVYHVSINGNYVMGRDGGGSIINFRTS